MSTYSDGAKWGRRRLNPMSKWDQQVQQQRKAKVKRKKKRKATKR